MRPNVERKKGSWHEADLECFTRMACDVDGDFGEIGVFRGGTLAKLIPFAKKQKKQTHGFDSFLGTAQPGTYDSRPKGDLSVGGPENFVKIMRWRGFIPDAYKMWIGYIPACFHRAEHLRFSFVIVDVDNYQATKDSLEWVWSRINTGGILALDDFYPHGDQEATKAIKEFVRDQTDFYILDYFNHQLFLKKLGCII